MAFEWLNPVNWVKEGGKLLGKGAKALGLGTGQSKYDAYAYGEPLLDKDGKPKLDENGNPMYAGGGWKESAFENPAQDRRGWITDIAKAGPRGAPTMQAATINRTGFNQGMGLAGNALQRQQAYAPQQAQALGLMQNAATGNAPSAAQATLQKGLEGGLAQQLAAANSARGGTAATMNAQRNAQFAGAQLAGQTAQDAAILRAQEMAQGREAYQGALAQNVGLEQAAQGLGYQGAGLAGTMAQSQAQLNQQAALSNQAAKLAMTGMDDARLTNMLSQLYQIDTTTMQGRTMLEQLKQQAYMDAEHLAQATATGNAANQVAFTGAVIGGLGALGGAALGGGGGGAAGPAPSPMNMSAPPSFFSNPYR